MPGIKNSHSTWIRLVIGRWLPQKGHGLERGSCLPLRQTLEELSTRDTAHSSPRTCAPTPVKQVLPWTEIWAGLFCVHLSPPFVSFGSLFHTCPDSSSSRIVVSFSARGRLVGQASPPLMQWVSGPQSTLLHSRCLSSSVISSPRFRGYSDDMTQTLPATGLGPGHCVLGLRFLYLSVYRHNWEYQGCPGHLC